MAEISEFAGNLLAELYDAREDARVGLITPEEHLQRIAMIRRRREAARQEMQRPIPEPQPRPWIPWVGRLQQ
jgi:hypothetical protein